MGVGYRVEHRRECTGKETDFGGQLPHGRAYLWPSAGFYIFWQLLSLARTQRICLRTPPLVWSTGADLDRTVWVKRVSTVARPQLIGLHPAIGGQSRYRIGRRLPAVRGVR